MEVIHLCGGMQDMPIILYCFPYHDEGIVADFRRKPVGAILAKTGS